MNVIVTGTVIHGRDAGKAIGFPTANLQLNKPLEIKEGVYYGVATLNGNTENCVLSYGTTPMFGTKTFEVHLFGKHEDFYGETLTVEIRGFIRTMEKYDTLDQLSTAIKQDVSIAVKCLA